jgi:hypothetical protein
MDNVLASCSFQWLESMGGLTLAILLKALLMANFMSYWPWEVKIRYYFYIFLNICAFCWGNFEAAFAKKFFLCGMWHLFIVVFRSVNY